MNLSVHAGNLSDPFKIHPPAGLASRSLSDEHIRKIVVRVLLGDLHDSAVREHLIISLLDLVPESLIAEFECDRILLCFLI